MRRAGGPHDVVDPGRVVPTAGEHPQPGVVEPPERAPTLRPQLPLLARDADAVRVALRHRLVRFAHARLWDRIPRRPHGAGPEPVRESTMLAVTLREAARRFADSPAYVTEAGWTLSSADLDRISDEVAVGLARRGLRTGDRPGAGAAARTRVPPRLPRRGEGRRDHGRRERPPHRRRAGRGARPAPSRDWSCAAPGFVPPRGSTPWSSTRLPTRGPCTGRFASPDAAPPPLPDDPDRPVAIVFTSGTTGMPKGALYGNRQLRLHHRQRRRATPGAAAVAASRRRRSPTSGS